MHSNRLFYEKVGRCALSGWWGVVGPGCATPPAHVPPPHPAAPFLPAGPLQAFAAWRESSDWGRVVLVKSLLLAAGFEGEIEVVRGVELPGGGGGGVLEAAKAWLVERLSWGGGAGDPFYCVIARKAE